ncbi:hypothetical protein LOD99_1116 [Oopsacas minuta]|nr:hypothetical protein LOD99_1116 [Oopsacas minuta]
MSPHHMNNQNMSPMRTLQAPRSNLSQTNSDFPSFPNPPNTPHLSPPPVPFGMARTPTPSIPDLHSQGSKNSCLSTPQTPFRYPSIETGSFSREEAASLPRQHSTPSHLTVNTPPSLLSTPKRGPGRKKIDSSLPFEQWILDHGLYPEYQKEQGREGQEFYYQLMHYLYEAQGGVYATPTRVPSVGGEEVNLFRLHRVVESHGGIKQVCEKKEWKQIFQFFNYQSKGAAGIKALKQIYLRWLLPFISHKRGEPIEPILELCRSATRTRKQQNCHSDTLSVTSPAPPSEESQDIPESPGSLISGMSSPSKLTRDRPTPCATLEDRPTSSDIKPFQLEEDTPHLPQTFKSDPLSFLDSTSPPYMPNRSKNQGLDILKPPKIKQEHSIPDGIEPHSNPYQYYTSMYPHIPQESYHVMPPKHPYTSRLMHSMIQSQRWSSPHKQEDWGYVPPRATPSTDTSRTQPAPAVHEPKSRVPRDKPVIPSSEVLDKPHVTQKRPSDLARGGVEYSTPIIRKRKKQPPNQSMTDPFRLTMALRSGVLTDTAWALDYLTILLNHNGTRDLYNLTNAHGLLDALVACWVKCLSDIFPGEIVALPEAESKLELTPLADEDLPVELRNVTQQNHTTLPILETPLGSKVTTTGTNNTSADSPDVEDEVVRPLDNVVFLHTTHETQCGHMAICISNLIRCLSFIPGNHMVLSKHTSLLSLIGHLLLLKHQHPEALCLSNRTEDSSDIFDTLEDTCDTSEYVLEANKCEWWWSYLENVREDIFVVLCNVAGALEFSLYPSSVTQRLLNSLIHWLICPSSMCHDPLPPLSNTTWLSPKRLVLESLSKLSVLPANVDYILATPVKQLTELIKELSKWSINKKDVIARQFVFMLLFNLCGTPDLCPHYVIARQTPILQVLMECIEMQPPNQRSNKLSTFQEELAFSLALKKRAGWTLIRLSTHPENHPLFLELQPRLLAIACHTAETLDTFKNDPHMRQIVLEIISNLNKD